MQKLTASRGFTIVELVVIIAVISILATISTVAYGNWRERVAKTEVRSDLSNAAKSMKDELNFKNKYPPSLPASYKSSPGVTITYVSGNDSTYCINGVSKNRPSIKYYIGSESQLQLAEGTCAGTPDGEVTPPGGGGGVIADQNDAPPSDDADMALCDPSVNVAGTVDMSGVSGPITIDAANATRHINLQNVTEITISGNYRRIICAGDSTKDMVVDTSGNARRVIITGSGDDQIDVSGTSPGLTYSGSGADSILTSGNANRTIYASSGDDYMSIGGNNAATVYAGSGGDVVDVSGGARKTVYGGIGDDALSVAGSENIAHYMYGDDGDDSLDAIASGNRQFMFGGNGNDNVVGGSGNDIIYGNSGTDTLDGRNGNDIGYDPDGAGSTTITSVETFYNTNE